MSGNWSTWLTIWMGWFSHPEQQAVLRRTTGFLVHLCQDDTWQESVGQVQQWMAGANSWVKLWWVLWYELLMNAYSPSNIYVYTLIIIIDWCNLIHIHHKYVYIYIYIHNVNLHFDGDMFQPAQNNRRSLRFYPYPSPARMCIRLPPFKHYVALHSSAEVRREIPLVRDLGAMWFWATGYWEQLRVT